MEETPIADDTSSEKKNSDERTDDLSIEVRDSLADINEQEWNALCTDGNPFLSYAFLYGLECTQCLGKHNGWYPRYFLLWDTSKEKQLVGAMPTYLKTNSYGEFVFDWAWAEAYERNNMPYYPKLVCSIPFTPATGQRILVHDTLPREQTILLLAQAARQFCHTEKYSGVHWLFITETENNVLCFERSSNISKTTYIAPENGPDNVTSNKSKAGFALSRIDCQYHWRNNDYSHFDDFLEKCTAKRRKTIRRERRHVNDAGIKLSKRLGNTLSELEWNYVHELYQSTFDRKWGNPSLTLAFFKRMGAKFGGNVLIVFAHDETADEPTKPIACSVMFIGKTVLYGRYWGCRAKHNSLHFEACYYQGIEFCIENGIDVFEPGAQGEHKITRGFEPTITRSAHYIAHPGFREAIAGFLDEETPYVEQRCSGLTDLLPFKHEDIVIK